jgi:ADP-heptose:LPS heptosyltransferase
MLAGARGADAARLLPGVGEVLEWRCPWIDPRPAPVAAPDVEILVKEIRSLRCDAAVVFTSFHQSALPTALILRMAGIRWVGAISEDYPGSLLDLRHRVDDDIPEAERALSLTEAAGFTLPRDDPATLRVRRPLPAVEGLPRRPYLVLHPGASVPARSWPALRFADTAEYLRRRGHVIVVTGGPEEKALTAHVAGAAGIDLGGRTSLAELASVLDGADAVVVANTGPAHLAAAAGTPVVSLFAPTVPATRWAPYGVPHVLLGDQHAPCRGTRATRCPVEGHPCLTSVRPEDVAAALSSLGIEPPTATLPSARPTAEEVCR